MGKGRAPPLAEVTRFPRRPDQTPDVVTIVLKRLKGSVAFEKEPSIGDNLLNTDSLLVRRQRGELQF